MVKLSAVSLYTGAGGLDYGFEAAGFETRVAVEMDADCCATLATNRAWPIIREDIARVSSARILEVAGLRKGEVEVLIGGPPCQPFSKSGYWVSGDAARLRDSRASTLFEYMRCVRDLLPRAFLLENVHGISYSGKEEGFLLLEQLTREINREEGVNYSLSWKVLDAAHYGVPQARVRFFLVGHRDGVLFRFPSPTHAPEEAPAQGTLLAISDARPLVTAWDAIGRFAPPPAEDLRVRGRWADLLPSIPEGQNYLWHTNRGGGLPLFGWRTRFWSFLLKLAKDRPSWTIQAQPGPAIGPFHWEDRRLSVEEMARLQTFPMDLTYVGSRLSVQRQLGNAVPGLLAEVLAREIRGQLLGCPVDGAPMLEVRLQRPIPPPEPVKPVPQNFLRLQGDHPDHPGEGKGGRAVQLSSGRSDSGVDSSLWDTNEARARRGSRGLD
jgi:DNA (cytosine-5)-methyltransferase 1